MLAEQPSPSLTQGPGRQQRVDLSNTKAVLFVLTASSQMQCLPSQLVPSMQTAALFAHEEILGMTGWHLPVSTSQYAPGSHATSCENDSNSPAGSALLTWLCTRRRTPQVSWSTLL